MVAIQTTLDGESERLQINIPNRGCMRVKYEPVDPSGPKPAQ